MSSNPAPARRIRLDYLDGLRACAALYVVLFHASVGFHLPEPPALLRAGFRLLAFGHEAVAVFIVLSGYCLMLSALGSGEPSQVRFSTYLGRRTFRILPPYYVTLLVSLLLIAAVPALGSTSPSGTIWDDSHPAFAAGSIVSHLLVVHNWFAESIHTINGPLWSVASEWQIYFFLPLVFLPAYRKFSYLGLLGAGLVLGYLPLLLWPAFAKVPVTWYLFLFAMGMSAALIGFSSDPSSVRLRNLIPWHSVASASLLLLGAAGIFVASVWFRYPAVTDALVGLATATLLVALALEHGESESRPGISRQMVRRLLRLFGSPRLVQVGHFSYSLYLTHLPILALIFFGLRRGVKSGTEFLGFTGTLAHLGFSALMVSLGLGLSMLLAFLFYRGVERHFIGSPARLFSKGRSSSI